MRSLRETGSREVNRRALTLARDSLNRQHCQLYRENYKDLFGKYRVVERPERSFQQKRGSEFMVVSKYLNRSSAIVQERSVPTPGDGLQREDILVLEVFKCAGDWMRNYLNVEVDIAMQQPGRSGVVLRYVRMDIYYLALEIEVSFVSLVKYYYNNRMVLERKHCPFLAPLGHWNRFLITLSGQLVQVLLVQNTP